MRRKKRSTIGAGNEKNAAMNVVVIRHPRENLKKCSLRHLHGRPNFEFLAASDGFSFDASGFTLLEIGAPEMSPADADRPVLLLDSTWHLLPRIRNKVFGNFVSRSLPPSIKTAYPRVSKMHSDPHGTRDRRGALRRAEIRGNARHRNFARLHVCAEVFAA